MFEHWMKYALAISVALNLALVGFSAGGLWRDHKGHRGGPPEAMFLKALPKSDRKELMENARVEHGHPARRKDVITGVIGTLRATPFDIEALARILRRQNAEVAQFHDRVQGSWLEHVANMADDERLSYAERLETLAQERGKKRRK